MGLTDLVADDNWQGFDEAWRTLMDGGEPIDELLRSLELVGRKRRMPRCMAFLREHANLLVEQAEPENAARLLGAALRGGGSPGEIQEPLLECAQAAWGAEDWWPAYSELSDFRSGSRDLRRAWGAFDDLRAYRPGLLIFHRAGWGSGEVTELDRAELMVVVRFQSGRTDRFPLSTAVEIFDLLPEDDLRALSFRDPDALRKMLKTQPLDILRSILHRYDGSASTVTLRNALMQVGITGNAWTSWWRKTRVLAENDEWFRVTGGATRAEVQLLGRPSDPVEMLTRQLRNCTTLAEALTRVRDLLTGGKVQEELKRKGVEVLDEMARDDTTPHADRLAVWGFLRDQLSETPEALRNTFAEAATQPAPTDPSVPPPLWAEFQHFHTAREQERCLIYLKETCGEEGWLDEASRNLAHATPGMVRPLIDALVADGRTKHLMGHYRTLLARPTRSPFVLIGLAKVIEGSDMPGELPTPFQRGQALLELAAYLQDRRKGNPLLSRAELRLADLVTKGEKPLFRKLFDDCGLPNLRTLQNTIQRGLHEGIDALVTDIIIEQAGAEAFEEHHAFWETDQIWTTRAGVARREAELREIRDVKIPANREALARAASFGDLSENAEWEQAIRDQGELSNQVTTIEKELRLVALLENAPITEDTVSPGTVVRYRELDTGSEQEIVLLGPWDTEKENAVYYRAPLPAGMLGRSAGEQATIELPGGLKTVEILDVEPAPYL